MEETKTAPEVAQTEPQEVQTEATQPKKSAKQVFAEYFTATRIAYMAIFTALSYVLRFLEFSLLPGTPVTFLKLDFSNIFPLIGGFALGPVAGVTIGALKEILWMPFSSTATVGELANIIVMLPFILIPSIGYKFKKGIKWVLTFIAISVVVEVVWCFPVNLLLNFPVFLGFNWAGGMSFFLRIDIWPWVLLFNLIKWVITAVLVLLLYKSVSKLIKFTNQKFTRKKPVENDNSSR